MNLCIYVCIYSFTDIVMNLCIYIYIFIDLYSYESMYLCMYIYIFIYRYSYESMYLYIHLSVAVGLRPCLPDSRRSPDLPLSHLHREGPPVRVVKVVSQGIH